MALINPASSRFLAFYKDVCEVLQLGRLSPGSSKARFAVIKRHLLE